MTDPEFQITDHLRAWGRSRGYNVDFPQHLDSFMSYLSKFQGKKCPYKDLNRAFMNCVMADWNGVRREAERKGTYWPKPQAVNKTGMEWIPGSNGETGKWVRTA